MLYIAASVRLGLKCRIFLIANGKEELNITRLKISIFYSKTNGRMDRRNNKNEEVLMITYKRNYIYVYIKEYASDQSRIQTKPEIRFQHPNERLDFQMVKKTFVVNRRWTKSFFGSKLYL